jgi:hypothetical protein
MANKDAGSSVRIEIAGTKMAFPAAWHAIKWIGPGIAMLLIGFVWSLIAVRQARLWYYADHYKDAELEVVRFYGKPRNSEARCRIEGVIHPGEEQVVTTDEYIAIKQRDGPEDRWGREPLSHEIEDKLLPVSHWPRQSEVRRWWYPPSVVGRGMIPGGGTVFINLLFGCAFLAAGLFSFRRGSRYVAESVLSKRGPTARNG